MTATHGVSWLQHDCRSSRATSNHTRAWTTLFLKLFLVLISCWLSHGSRQCDLQVDGPVKLLQMCQRGCKLLRFGWHSSVTVKKSADTFILFLAKWRAYSFNVIRFVAYGASLGILIVPKMSYLTSPRQKWSYNSPSDLLPPANTAW